MAGMVFEPHDAAAVVGVGGGGGDVVFCVVILCLSALSMIIFAASAGVGDDGLGKRRRPGRANGPVFVGGRGCACGGCRPAACVCGTYLS